MEKPIEPNLGSNIKEEDFFCGGFVMFYWSFRDLRNLTTNVYFLTFSITFRNCARIIISIVLYDLRAVVCVCVFVTRV